MRFRLFPPLALLGLTLLSATGCGGALTMSQRLAGEWIGRPETVADRTVREWPGHADGKEVSADDPEVAEAIAAAPVTDLQTAAPEAIVRMTLGELGKATLSLDGEQPLEGKWQLTPLDGRRAQLEIEVQAAGSRDDDEGEDDADGEATESVRRRFDLEFFKKGEAFTLREQSADRRFGRLVFRRPGDTGQPTETVTTESRDAEPDAASTDS